VIYGTGGLVLASYLLAACVFWYAGGDASVSALLQRSASAPLMVKDFDHFWYILKELLAQLPIGLVIPLPFHFCFQSVISFPLPQVTRRHEQFPFPSLDLSSCCFNLELQVRKSEVSLSLCLACDKPERSLSCQLLNSAIVANCVSKPRFSQACCLNFSQSL
jgi:hypothetical protein